MGSAGRLSSTIKTYLPYLSSSGKIFDPIKNSMTSQKLYELLYKYKDKLVISELDKAFLSKAIPPCPKGDNHNVVKFTTTYI